MNLKTSKQLRSLPRRSPSAEEGGHAVRADTLFRAGRQASRGTMVHAWLESLEWVEAFEIDEERMLARGEAWESDLEQRREALRDLDQALRNDKIRRALSQASCGAPEGTAVEVFNERTFSLVLPGDDGQEHLWTGSIDRLVVASKEGVPVWAEVIDYKTDRVEGEALKQRVDFYRPQLENYARVVAIQTGLDLEKIGRKLVFLSARSVVEA